MAVTYTKALLGLQDLSRHDPATDGTTATTVNRLTSTGGTTPITKLQASAIPLLDAAVLAGSLTPFEALADTQAAKNVEIALQTLRKQQYPVYNFGFYGGIEGTGTSQANSDQNRLLFNQLVSDIPSTGGVIFFPPGNWLVDGPGGAVPILQITGKSNITVMGAGFGSILRAFDASSGTDLLKFLNCSNITVQNMALNAIQTGAGANINVSGSVGNQISQIRIFSVFTNNGGDGIFIAGGGGHGNGYWVQNSYIVGAPGTGISVQDMTLGNITGNLLSLAAGGPAGIAVFDDVSAGSVVGNVNIESNILTGAGDQEITVQRATAVYDPTIHLNVRLSRNRISRGSMKVAGMDKTEMSFNELLDGGYTYTITNMATSAKNFRALYNYSESAPVEGLFVDVGVASLDDWEIVGGRYHGANSHGIFISQSTSGTLQNGRLSGVCCLNNNVANGGGSGIRILGGGGTTITRNSVSHNIIRSDAAPKHVHGIHASSAGTISNNFYSLNVVHGWQTSAYNVTGFAENVAGINEDLGA